MIFGQKSLGNVNHISTPRAIILLNGHSVQYYNWQVNLNSNHMADDFSITLPFQVTDEKLPPGYLVQTNDNLSWLFALDNILVEIWVGYPENPEHFTTKDLSRIMYGYMDTAELDFSNQSTKGELVVLTGRNMAGPLLDNKTTIKYQNMTSSQVVEAIAAKFNLDASVHKTFTHVGTYFQTDTTAVSKDVSYWDLIAFLANQEGFEFRIFDKWLYFGPLEETIGNVLTNGFYYAWGQNIRDFQLSKSPHAAKDIKVEVHSFDKVQVKHVSAVRTKTRKSASVSLSGGTSNARAIWNYFAGQGLPANLIAAIMGNMQQESTLNPNQAGGGLCQWGGGRWTGLFSYCRENNLDPYSIEGQCAFCYWELRSGGWVHLSSLWDMSIEQATAELCWNYEKPDARKAMESTRVQYARNWYNTFAGQTGGSRVSYITTGGKVTYTTQNKNVKATAEYSNGASSSSSHQYLMRYYFPGLTQEQCQIKAEQILKKLSLTELTGQMTVRGNEKLTIDRKLDLRGLGYKLNGNYYVRQVSHNWDLTNDGYRCDVTFSNLLLQDAYSGGM